MSEMACFRKPSASSILYLTLMRCCVLPIALLLMSLGCSRPQTATRSTSEHPTVDKNVDGAASASSQFTVKVKLSDAARKKLIDESETIIVAGYFTGHPKQGTEPQYLDIKSGDVVLGDVKQEIRPGETAIFKELNLNPNALARIDSKGPHILINVFSGRRSSKNNLLDCDYFDGDFESIRGGESVIRCQLIQETFPRSGL